MTNDEQRKVWEDYSAGLRQKDYGWLLAGFVIAAIVGALLGIIAGWLLW